MADYNLPEDEAAFVKHLLTNISSAVCRRLDAIDEQLESVCINTWCIENRIDQLWPWSRTNTSHHPVAQDTNKLPVGQDGEELICAEDLLNYVNVGDDVNIITLNTEDEFPDGSWLGDVNNPVKRVRVPISAIDLTHIHANCQTAVKMALTLLDYLFDRDTLAVSNLSGTGKHCKQQLDPLMIYGIQCHLEKWFGISGDDWQKIRLNIDSKCRSAYRRKVLGLPHGGKAFHCRDSQPDVEDVTSRETDAEVCVDDGGKIHLTENHPMIQIVSINCPQEVQNFTEEPVYQSSPAAVVKHTGARIIVPADSEAASVLTWTDVDTADQVQASHYI